MISGVLLTVRNSDNLASGRFEFETDHVLPRLLHATVNESCNDVALNFVDERTFVYAVHGRSTRTCVWSLDELLNSNDQLVDLDPRKQDIADGERLCDLLIPLGGVREGLCGKVILLSRSRQT